MTPQQLRAKADQSEKVDLLHSLHNNGVKKLGFFGKAGVGKTYCASALIQRITMNQPNKYTIVGVAISHAAKNVLQKSMGNIAEITTVASLLQLKKEVNEETGEITFKPAPSWGNKTPLIEKADILIVDECSQISKQLKKQIEAGVRKKCTIIYLGDHHQTPPVDKTKEGNKDSPTFKVPHVKLTIPYRYEGDIEELSNAIADAIDRGNDGKGYSMDFLEEFMMPGKSLEYAFYNSEQYYEEAKDAFKDISHPREVISICYRNAIVKKENEFFRQGLASTKEQFIPGEIVLCKEGYFQNGLPVLSAHSVYTVQSKTEGFITIALDADNDLHSIIESPILDNAALKRADIDLTLYEIPIYKLVLTDEEGTPIYDIPVPRIMEDKSLDECLKKLAARCAKIKNNWKDFYKIKEFLAGMQYAFSANTYVVQGATYDRVFVNLKDIKAVKPISTKEKLQSLYTAVTRAKFHVSILI